MDRSGSYVICTLMEENEEEGMGSDHGHDRVSGRGMIMVLFNCSHVVRASINVLLC